MNATIRILAASFLAVVSAHAFARAKPAAAQAPKAAHVDPKADDAFDWGRFGRVTVYKPNGAPKSVVLFLSGDGGWELGVLSMADSLRKEGALVAGIDLKHYLKALEEAKDDCVYPAGEFEDFSHHLQSKYRLAEYRYPILVGFSSGATLAYALLAQAPSGTFAGGEGLGFCPDFEVAKPLCAKNQYKGVKSTRHKGVDIAAVPALKDPFVALQGEIDQICQPEATKAFIDSIPGAEIVLLPKVGHGYSVERNWMPQFMAAYRKLATSSPQAAPPPPSVPDVAGLPLIEVPATRGESDLLALLITGDGGWAGLDQDVAAALSARGVPVVALNSLKYYWSPHDAQQSAHDVDRIVNAYLAKWGKSRVVLLGYSQGADVMPFVLNRLPAQTRAKIAGAAVIGMSETAVFEFHFSNWVRDPKNTLPTRPEIDKLRDVKLTCIFGAEEKDSLCPALGDRATLVKLPGGHHFNGDYEKVAQAVLAAVK
jgi:type IV secretory pathway VirJ component